MKKCTFEKLQENMSYFLDFQNIEQKIDDLIKQETSMALLSKAHNGNRPKIDVLTDYLEGDEKKLNIIVGISGGSIEKLKRIVASIFGQTPLSRVTRNKEMRHRIASFLIDPKSEPSFIPQFIRKSFCLPDNWIELLKNEEYLSAIARDMMIAKYSARMGFELENTISSKIKRLGYNCEKGAVSIVDNKEVDIAIPTTISPQILIMVSYLLTTSSAQSSKANEQARMYNSVQQHNRSRTRGKHDYIFINVVDGGGWIARQKDLRLLWMNCDYCFTYKTLNDFEGLVKSILNRETDR